MYVICSSPLELVLIFLRFYHFFSMCFLSCSLFLPNFFCSFYDLLLFENDGCDCVSAYIPHMPMYICVRCSNRCVSMYECVLAFVVSFSRQPLKMVDNIFFWWQQTALQLQQRYQTHWKLTAFGWEEMEDENSVSIFIIRLFTLFMHSSRKYRVVSLCVWLCAPSVCLDYWCYCYCWIWSRCICRLAAGILHSTETVIN